MDELELLESNMRMVEHLIRFGVLKTPSIIGAFEAVPRHRFVTGEQLGNAYEDIALPTVNDSTISQPSTIATMLEVLGPGRGDCAMEVGMGSGYVACLLAECVGNGGKAVTIEIDDETFRFGEGNIRRSGLANIIPIKGDGSAGYAKLAPYDRILYSVGVNSSDDLASAQLKIGGRLVAPIGRDVQTLTAVDRISKDGFAMSEYGPFVFLNMKKPKECE